MQIYHFCQLSQRFINKNVRKQRTCIIFYIILEREISKDLLNLCIQTDFVRFTKY